jgi:hypothetical protein
MTMLMKMRLPRILTIGLLGVASLGIAGCTTDVAGVVLDARELPVRDAFFTVGLPTGVGTFGKYPVDQDGKFNFHIAPTDESQLYLWNGKGDPQVSIVHIDHAEISDHMRLHYQSEGVGF